MRASELIGQPVLDVDGAPLGIVIDLRCVQDGPISGGMASLRVDALVVSGRHTGSLLGYDRREQQGPWLIRKIVQRLHRNLRIIPCSELDFAGPQLRLTAPAGVEGRSR